MHLCRQRLGFKWADSSACVRHRTITWRWYKPTVRGNNFHGARAIDRTLARVIEEPTTDACFCQPRPDVGAKRLGDVIARKFCAQPRERALERFLSYEIITIRCFTRLGCIVAQAIAIIDVNDARGARSNHRLEKPLCDDIRKR